MANERGSDKLTAERLGKPVTISTASLTKVIDAIERDGVRVIDWTILGQPGPETIRATVQVSTTQTGSFVQNLLTVDDVRVRVDQMFPEGIVNPEAIQISFTARGRLG